LVTFAHTTDNGSKEDDAKRIHVSLERDRATHYIFRWHIAIEMVKKKTKKFRPSQSLKASDRGIHMHVVLSHANANIIYTNGASYIVPIRFVVISSTVESSNILDTRGFPTCCRGYEGGIYILVL
jgi:hypothetical protein